MARWRKKKRFLRELGTEIGFPECLRVAHQDQIDGLIHGAGVRLRYFYKAHRARRTEREARAKRDEARARRRAYKAASARGELPF